MPNESGQSTLFLSYAHADQAQAQRLATALRRAGFTVWWDALIEGGSSYAATIRDALSTADTVIVLWSRQSVDSDWVRDEAAQGRDRRRLVPLSLDGTPPPLGFGQIQVIDISRWNGRSNAPQFQSIRRALAAAISGAPAAPAGAIEAPVTRRHALALGAGAAVAIAGGGAFVAWKSGVLGTGSTSARSIAVLPFKNLSSDSAQSYLSDGLTEEVRSALSRNLGLMVLAPTSSNAARNMTGDAIAIAGKLGVGYLLEGTVERAGSMVRVSTALTNGRTGFNEWSQRVERRLDDIFVFESEIARTVASALSVRMATDDPSPGGTRNVQAYEAYLRGRALYNLAMDEETDRQARGNFEVALGADPKFALAHAALSRVLASIAAETSDASALKRLYSAAESEARQAIRLAPTLAQGHLALGYALFAGQLDIRGARPSYDQAYRYGRGDADIVLLYALYVVRGRRFEEARAAIERALALDPLNPRTHRAAGTIAYASRRYADAIVQYRRALELNPKISNAHALMADCLMELGRMDEARAAYAAEPAAMFRLRGQAVIEHRLGNRAAAEQALARLVSDIGDAAMYQQAEVLAQWGRADEALIRLRRAREIGDSGLSLIVTDPLLDPIVRNPSFVRFVKDLGF